MRSKTKSDSPPKIQEENARNENKGEPLRDWKKKKERRGKRTKEEKERDCLLEQAHANWVAEKQCTIRSTTNNETETGEQMQEDGKKQESTA